MSILNVNVRLAEWSKAVSLSLTLSARSGVQIPHLTNIFLVGVQIHHLTNYNHILLSVPEVGQYGMKPRRYLSEGLLYRDCLHRIIILKKKIMLKITELAEPTLSLLPQCYKAS